MNPPSIQISIKEVQLLDFSFTERVEQLKEPLPQNAYEFQFSAQAKVISTDKALGIQLMVSLFEKQNNERKIELCKIETRTIFHVENFEEVIKIDAENIAIPEVLTVTCNSIAFSTTRGMLVISLQDSIIKNAIMPIINPQVFLPPR